jgi:hypothetical protein
MTGHVVGQPRIVTPTVIAARAYVANSHTRSVVPQSSANTFKAGRGPVCQNTLVVPHRQPMGVPMIRDCENLMWIHTTHSEPPQCWCECITRNCCAPGQLRSRETIGMVRSNVYKELLRLHIGRTSTRIHSSPILSSLHTSEPKSPFHKLSSRCTPPLLSPWLLASLSWLPQRWPSRM